MLQEVKKTIRSITIEPNILIYIFGLAIIFGAQVPTNLLIWKLCTKDLNFTEAVCNNLSAEANDAAENEVQRKLQSFEMVSQWIKTTPTLIYAFVMGSLSDKFGRKPLLLLPMIGQVIDGILQLINYQFIDTLPSEFFYAIAVYNFLGGPPMYYLGFYSFGSNVSAPKERAARLARLDGVEQMGVLLGVLVSPLIFNKYGYFGSFGASLAFTFAGLLYLIVFIREVIDTQAVEKISWDPLTLLKTLVSPVKELAISILKKRPEGRRNLVLLQILVYSIYWFILETYAINYVYFKKIFKEDFDGEDYSHVTVFKSIRDMFACIILMPILSTKLKIHEGLLISFSLALECAGYLMFPFITKIWHIYFAEAIMFLGFIKYAAARSMISKCVEPNELGKIFSGMSIMAAFVPFISNPAYRTIYSNYLDVFPGAPFLLSSAFVLLAAILNFYLYTQRHRMKSSEEITPSQTNPLRTKNAYPQSMSTSL